MKMRDFVPSKTAVATAVDKGVIARVLSYDPDTLARWARPGHNCPRCRALHCYYSCSACGLQLQYYKHAPAQPQPKPPELLTGRAAFYKTLSPPAIMPRT